MLFSQREERSRQFALALRAGLPILLLIVLLFYITLYQDKNVTINLNYLMIFAVVVFFTVYLIYFLIDVSVEESLIDNKSKRFNTQAFIQQLKGSKANTLALIQIVNIQTLYEHYSPMQIDGLYYTLTQKLNITFKQYGLKNVPIGAYRESEFLIATQDSHENLHAIIDKFIQTHQSIDNIEVHLKFATIQNSENDFEKAIVQLHDILRTQLSDVIKSNEIVTSKDAKALSKIEASVISAIQEKKLLLQFRPLLHINDNTIDTYEITVKLSLEEDSVLPRVFLPIINRLGLARDYDYLVVEQLVMLLQEIKVPLSFTFNLSPYSLRDKAFQKKVFALIQQSGIDASSLIIQLYERNAHHNLGGYLETLQTFRDAKFRICIDNFGSSNASMEYMKHFKFDMVQFDKDYITQLNNPTSDAMLSSLISMSKELGIKTIGKWVDEAEQKERLIQLGVDYIKGFHVAKPINQATLVEQYN